MKIIKLKNNTQSDGTWAGQTISAGETYTLAQSEILNWTTNTGVFAAISSGDLIVCNGQREFIDPIEGWKWLTSDDLPKSYLGDKLAVHSSPAPTKPDSTFFMVWTGAGDDLTNNVIGGGDMLDFDFNGAGPETKSVDAFFSPIFGDVYLQAGACCWEGGSHSDVLYGDIRGLPTELQQSVNLDLILDGTTIKYSPSGPGTGTHGFASTPVLIPRTFAKDGDWDYSAATGLVPNMTGTGRFNLSTEDTLIHRYINRASMCMNSNGYQRFDSEESAFLPPGCYIRITVENNSGSAIKAGVIIKAFREATTNGHI